MTLPNQRTSRKAKEKKQWQESTVKYYIEQSDIFNVPRERIRRAYDIYYGKINQRDYEYVINPFNTPHDKYKRFPAKLRHYPVLESRIQKMLGEKIQRPFHWNVTSSNPDVVSQYDKRRHQLYLENLSNMFLNTINQAMDTGVDDQPVMTPQKLQEALAELPKDTRIKQGYEALEYIWQDQKLEEKFIDGFQDWLITDRVFTYKSVHDNDIEYELVPPDELDYDKSPSTTLIEDGEWAVRRKVMTVSDVIDRFNDILTEDEMDDIQESYARDGYTTIRNWNNDTNDVPDRLVEVIHVVWKSYVKYGRLQVVNPYGELDTIEIDEDYKLSPEEKDKVEWKWRSEVWEGYRINENIYTGIQPHPVQRHSMSSRPAKLPYNGRRLSIRNHDGLSLFEKCIPYQLLYNIFHYRFEMTMAKSHDKIVLLPRNIISNTDGWTEDTFMYYATSTGFAFVDIDSPTDIAALQNVKVLDASLDRYAASALEVMRALVAEIDNTLGMSPQRMGEMGNREGKAVAEAAIHQSATISEDVFYKYEKFQESELQGLLDTSKYAFLEGMKRHFTTRDGRELMMEIYPEDYVSTDYDVFVKVSVKEQQKLDLLRQTGHAFAQNSSRPSMIAELYDTDNFSKIKSLIAKYEQAERQYQQSIQQAEQNAELQKAQMEQMEKEKDRMLEKYNIDQQTYRTIQASIIQATGFDSEEGNVPDMNEVLDNLREHNLKQKELQLKQQEINADLKISEDKVRVAKENKTQAELNKSN